MKTNYWLKHYILFCILAIAALIAIYGGLALAGNIHTTQSNPITVMPNVSCSYPDKSFCSSDHLFRNLMIQQDFSALLQNQLPSTVTCSPGPQVQPYCKNVQNSLEIRLYKVQEGPRSTLLTHNSYIDFFKTYFQQYGPFAFVDEAPTGHDAAMRFVNTDQTKQLVLTFEKINMQWKLLYVTVSS